MTSPPFEVAAAKESAAVITKLARWLSTRNPEQLKKRHIHRAIREVVSVGITVKNKNPTVVVCYRR
jgi:hypothetical protein